MIPYANPKAQYLTHRLAIDAALARVLASGQYILGEEVRQFEQEFAQFLGVAHAISCGSGTEALHLALVAAGIGPGDEVITVSHTAVATVAAIELAGATPVLVDIDPATYTLDPARVQAALTPRTKAILPVHLYGQPADLTALGELARRYGLRLIEDCAQATGAQWQGKRVGTFGDAGCFSFYPTKNLGALGDGGMVVTNDHQLAAEARRRREYGWFDRYISSCPGWNSRLDELQAAVLRVKLPFLDAENRRRQAIADRYDSALAELEVGIPARQPAASHVFHLYVIRHPQREQLLAHCHAHGVAPGVHYPLPVHLQPAYRGRIATAGPLTESERAAREVLSLPIYPELQPEEVEMVIATLRAFREEGR
ncbi:MAG: glutamine--scyllo-inositol aminotransferase [Dehalococcoidia bacterium]|nr:MAG: glutamine--scyllo-inositol aminotransferase [Dehalococcoidia bacterium]